jgi:hypothetical protein
VSSRRDPRDLRASDADRERVVAVLAEAAGDGRLTLEEHAQRMQRAYSARTLGDLARLTEDLAGPAAQPLRLEDSRSIAVLFRREERAGRWVVPDRLLVTAMGSHVALDFREALLQGRHTVIQATLVGSQLHLLIPEGVDVAVIRARGSRRYQAEPGPPPRRPGDRPLIEVRAFTVAGLVRVYTPRPPGRRLGLFPRRSR